MELQHLPPVAGTSTPSVPIVLTPQLPPAHSLPSSSASAAPSPTHVTTSFSSDPANAEVSTTPPSAILQSFVEIDPRHSRDYPATLVSDLQNQRARLDAMRSSISTMMHDAYESERKASWERAGETMKRRRELEALIADPESFEVKVLTETDGLQDVIELTEENWKKHHSEYKVYPIPIDSLPVDRIDETAFLLDGKPHRAVSWDYDSINFQSSALTNGETVAKIWLRYAVARCRFILQFTATAKKAAVVSYFILCEEFFANGGVYLLFVGHNGIQQDTLEYLHHLQKDIKIKYGVIGAALRIVLVTDPKKSSHNHKKYMLGIDKESGALLNYSGSANLGESGISLSASAQHSVEMMGHYLMSDEEVSIVAQARFDRSVYPELHESARSTKTIRLVSDYVLGLACSTPQRVHLFTPVWIVRDPRIIDLAALQSSIAFSASSAIVAHSLSGSARESAQRSRQQQTLSKLRPKDRPSSASFIPPLPNIASHVKEARAIGLESRKVSRATTQLALARTKEVMWAAKDAIMATLPVSATLPLPLSAYSAVMEEQANANQLADAQQKKEIVARKRQLLAQAKRLQLSTPSSSVYLLVLPLVEKSRKSTSRITADSKQRNAKASSGKSKAPPSASGKTRTKRSEIVLRSASATRPQMPPKSAPSCTTISTIEFMNFDREAVLRDHSRTVASDSLVADASASAYTTPPTWVATPSGTRQAASTSNLLTSCSFPVALSPDAFITPPHPSTSMRALEAQDVLTDPSNSSVSPDHRHAEALTFRSDIIDRSDIIVPDAEGGASEPIQSCSELSSSSNSTRRKINFRNFDPDGVLRQHVREVADRA